ncbi:MAG: 2-isopropylmalate synthase, partial [Chloroflexi bacterium]|nr:2-isopropylmalate synthase [Chloroflexota bacterium]
IDALAEVTVRVKSDGHTFIGRGAASDIVVASAKAYVNALNRILAEQRASEPVPARMATP